ncbi:hypothetical protein ACP4OV_028861 [Aristida adscensionis]
MASIATAAVALLIVLAARCPISWLGAGVRGAAAGGVRVRRVVGGAAVRAGAARRRAPTGARRRRWPCGGTSPAAAGWSRPTPACAPAASTRAALGLPVASDAAEDRRFARALCSAACRGACPNIVDLYATLAAGEGMSLPALCEAQELAGGNRRMMLGMSPLGSSGRGAGCCGGGSPCDYSD